MEQTAIFIQENAIENGVCKKWRPFCLGLNVLTHIQLETWVGSQLYGY